MATLLAWLIRQFCRRPDPPDPLWRFGPKDAFTDSQAFEHVIAFGASGSGKSSTLAHLMARMLGRGWGMLVLTSKGSDLQAIRELAAEQGRSADLIVVTPGAGHSFDFITHEIEARGGGVPNAVQLLSDLSDAANRMKAGNARDPFWPMAAVRLIQAAVTALHWATKRASPLDLYRFLASLPTSVEQRDSDDWKNTSYCAQVLHAAKEVPGWEDDPDLNLASDHVLNELPRTGEKTLAGITATAMTVISRFIAGDVRDLVNGRTLSPQAVLDGKVVVIHTPPLVYAERGRLLQLAWKLSFLRAVMRREVNATTVPVCLWQDEYQLHAVPTVDAMAQAVARSHRLAVVAAVQNFPLLEKALEGKEDALALLGNFGTRLVFGNSCSETNSLMAETIGKCRKLFFNGSAPTGEYDPVGEAFGLGSGGNGSAGFSEQETYDLSPREFLTLMKGGPENGFVVTCWAFQNGRRFSDGKTHKLFAFRQRG